LEKILAEYGFDLDVSYVFVDNPGHGGSWNIDTFIGYVIPVEICRNKKGKTAEFLGLGKYSKVGRRYSHSLAITPYEREQIDEILDKSFSREKGFLKAVWK
jgi:hypothetical protein